jgi:L-cysteine:1D-myo-inositol 2-amino-2-deoxy-alpha-D-glucopyranoside ligase
LRLLLLDRPWASGWDFSWDALTAAGERLDALYTAAGTPAASEKAAAAVLDRLRSDLDVPAAVQVGLEEGGTAARLVIALLGLGE